MYWCLVANVFQNVLKMLCAVYNPFEETMFALKPHSHSLNVHQGPKTLNKVGIVLDIVMFRAKSILREDL